jgi:hypothetical protein
VKPSRKGTARLRESVHTFVVAGREWRAPSRRATGGADGRRESGDGEQEIDPEQGRNEEEEERFALGGADLMPFIAPINWVRSVAGHIKGNQPGESLNWIFWSRSEGLNSGWSRQHAKSYLSPSCGAD